MREMTKEEALKQAQDRLADLTQNPTSKPTPKPGKNFFSGLKLFGLSSAEKKAKEEQRKLEQAGKHIVSSATPRPTYTPGGSGNR